MLDAVFKLRSNDSLAPRSTDQEAEELEEGVEDTGESIGIERNRGKDLQSMKKLNESCKVVRMCSVSV